MLNLTFLMPQKKLETVSEWNPNRFWSKEVHICHHLSACFKRWCVKLKACLKNKAWNIIKSFFFALNVKTIYKWFWKKLFVWSFFVVENEPERHRKNYLLRNFVQKRVRKVQVSSFVCWHIKMSWVITKLQGFLLWKCFIWKKIWK